ncbi:MAG: hypothetical protein IPN89_01970 [Saprospiraceae bacterium]|nr:hypothetical protein [Saprospiraceae bacterium]
MSAYRSLAKKADKDQEVLKFIIQDITKSFKDHPKMLEDATGYGEKLYQSSQSPESLNLYCSLLVMSKQVDKAIKTVTEAKLKAEKEGKDVSSFDGLLQYLNSRKA